MSNLPLLWADCAFLAPPFRTYDTAMLRKSGMMVCVSALSLKSSMILYIQHLSMSTHFCTMTTGRNRANIQVFSTLQCTIGTTPRRFTVSHVNAILAFIVYGYSLCSSRQ